VKRFWTFINGDLGRLLVGFVLTTVVGGALINWYQHSTKQSEQSLEAERRKFEWERDKRFEMLKRRLDNGERAIEQIADAMDSRMYRLREAFDAIRDGMSADDRWRQYAESVEAWNRSLGSNRSRVRRLIGEEAAQEFQNFETDDVTLSAPRSIHGRFFLAHRMLLEYRRCRREGACVEKAAQLAPVLNQLDIATDAFVERTTSMFLERAAELETTKLETR
jgi:hypothetical protein